MLMLLVCFTSYIISCSIAHAEPVFQQLVNFEDKTTATLSVEEGEEPVDALFQFSTKYGLDKVQRQNLQSTICNKIMCTRSKAKVWSTPVFFGRDKYVDEFILFEDEEPIDSIHKFCEEVGLGLGFRRAILAEACNVVDCMREKPLLWAKSIHVDIKKVHIQVLEGEEVADKIFEALLPYSVPFEGRKEVMALAKVEGVSFSREHAHILSESIVVNDNDERVLNIFDDESEAIDSVYRFCEENGLTNRFQELADSVMPRVCKLLLCRRTEPVVYAHMIQNKLGIIVGTIEVLLHEEPVDAVHRFAAVNGLDVLFRDSLAKELCEKIVCKRVRPVVYTKDVNDSSGKLLGVVKVFEGEEVIDAAVRFLRESKADVDGIALKNYLFDDACKQNLVKCTRNIAHFSWKLDIGHLIVRENEEPADAVNQFCKEKGCGDKLLMSIINIVCDSDLVICNRRKPVVFSMPLTDPEGNAIGLLGVQLDEEPADAVYRFFATHGLFERDWNLGYVISQICELGQVDCKRRRALKYCKESFMMGKIDIGPLRVWEDEEVIDILYRKRIDHNLTLHDQMESFSKICTKRDIYCKRSRAIVYELKDITKQDFEKYGNETCVRKYMGWTFLSSVADSYFGSKLKTLAQNESIDRIATHPLFSILSLVSSMFGVYTILVFARKVIKIHGGHESAIYAFALLLVCLMQAILVEPGNQLDRLMHYHEGKLPDLHILEGQEPVDAILQWAKVASKDHHPIVREPIYWDLIEKACLEINNVKCNRKRAWEYIDMGKITVHGQNYEIELFNPSVDPLLSEHKFGPQEPQLCVDMAVQGTCARIVPPLKNCEEDLIGHISKQLHEYNEKRLTQKDVYTKLRLTMDAPQGELFLAAASIIKSRGMNISPFKRVDNGTESYPKWDIHTTEAFQIMDSHHKVKDLESRVWYDKPCTPYFGGAMCAKTDADGNMIIEV